MELKNTRRRCGFFNLRRDLWDERLQSIEIKTVSVKGSPGFGLTPKSETRRITTLATLNIF